MNLAFSENNPAFLSILTAIGRILVVLDPRRVFSSLVTSALRSAPCPGNLGMSLLDQSSESAPLPSEH